jgi:hypothetical protein
MIRVQATFREHSGTFGEHSATFREHSGNIQERSGNIQGTFRNIFSSTEGVLLGAFAYLGALLGHTDLQIFPA